MPEVAAAAAMPAAMSAMPAMPAAMAAVAVTTLGLGRRIRCRHQETRYAHCGEAINSDQSAERQAGGQEFPRSTLFVPEHFITFCNPPPH